MAPSDSDAFSTSLQHDLELFDDKNSCFGLMKLTIHSLRLKLDLQENLLSSKVFTLSWVNLQKRLWFGL